MVTKVPVSFHRLQLLSGVDGYNALANTSVIVFGVGGVGSWCAEGLIRSGVGKLTIVDSDQVCVTNVNRQLQATLSTVGEVKVEALKKRLLDINPRAEITALEMIYDKESYQQFDLSSYDYVIDAIDSLAPKKLLIEEALKADTTLYASMGAALKLDPTRVQVAKIHKTLGCPLARLIRKHLQQKRIRKRFYTVFSDELLDNHQGEIGCGTGTCVCPQGDPGKPAHEWCSTKKQINGSLAHITAQFGMMLSGLVIQDVMIKADALKKVR